MGRAPGDERWSSGGTWERAAGDIDHSGGLRHPDGAASVAWTRENGAVPHRPWNRRARRKLGGALVAAVAVVAPALAPTPAYAQLQASPQSQAHPPLPAAVAPAAAWQRATPPDRPGRQP